MKGIPFPPKLGISGHFRWWFKSNQWKTMEGSQGDRLPSQPSDVGYTRALCGVRSLEYPAEGWEKLIPWTEPLSLCSFRDIQN